MKKINSVDVKELDKDSAVVWCIIGCGAGCAITGWFGTASFSVFTL